MYSFQQAEWTIRKCITKLGMSFKKNIFVLKDFPKTLKRIYGELFLFIFLVI